MRDVDIIFARWKDSLKSQGTQIYIKDCRDSYLVQLIDMLMEGGIDFETAKRLKKDVIDFLVSKEGKKGNGAHRGWTKSVGDEFLVTLDSLYPLAPTMSSGESVNPAFIFDWIGFKFNDKEASDTMKKTFIEEVLMSDWVKSRENVPEWASIFFRESEFKEKNEYNESPSFEIKEKTTDSEKSKKNDEDWCY